MEFHCWLMVHGDKATHLGKSIAVSELRNYLNFTLSFRHHQHQKGNVYKFRMKFYDFGNHLLPIVSKVA